MVQKKQQQQPNLLLTRLITDYILISVTLPNWAPYCAISLDSCSLTDQENAPSSNVILVGPNSQQCCSVTLGLSAKCL